MQHDKIKDPGIQTKHTRLEKEERHEINNLIRYALQAYNASKFLKEVSHDSDTKSDV